MKKEIFFRFWGGIKILKWKLISGLIVGIIFGSLSFNFSLQNKIFDKSPIVASIINILFFLIAFFAGFLAIATKYKKSPPPKNKSDSS